jgi:hypothetical protein
MSPRDYYARVDGYNNKRRNNAEILRLSVWASLSNWQGSISYNEWALKYFPLWFDETPDFSPVEVSKEEIENIFKRHDELHKQKSPAKR